ncbi:MAG: 30S ribosomal protein S6 [Candidatus Dormibacteria bacterium]
MDREYELFYIVRPDVEEEQVRGAMDAVATLVAGQGGEVAKSSLWGRRRLAYGISGFNDGYYVVKEVRLPSDRIRELDRQLRLDERVIRHLISLKQVYYLPGDEDRRGRVRGRGRDRGSGAEVSPAPAGPPDGEEIEGAEQPQVVDAGVEAPVETVAEEAEEVGAAQPTEVEE